MLRRRFLIVPLVLLLGCLAVLPACKKKKTEDTGTGGANPTPVIPQTPSGDTGGYVAFAQFKAKDILESALFKEVKDAFAKSGGTAMWDELEGKVAKETGGVKPTDIDTVTLYVTEIPKKDVMPKVVVIVNSNKAFDKNALVSKIGPLVKADARGFYGVGGPDKGLIHFPDDKTLVFLHPDLAQSYLNGYAKNRNSWPVSADLSKAAAGHMLYAIVNLDKIPREMFNGPEAREFGSLLTARSVSVSVDLKGKEIVLGARATFPDAAKAGEAKATVQKFVDMGIGFLDDILKGKGPPELAQFSSAMPAIQEAQRALKDAKIAVSGSDLTIAGSYKFDFDLGKMAMEATKQLVGSSEKMTAENNLKQIGLALHNYASAYNQVPIQAIGAKGMPLRNPNDKQLLSWRVAILPFIEQDNLYKQFKLDEPWDSANNKKLIAMMPKLYAPVNKPGKEGYTHLQMVIGPNAMQLPSVRFPASFPDGMSNTIAVVEAAQPVIWTKPDDVMLTAKDLPKDLKKKFGGLQPDGFNVLLWDGSVRFLKNTISDQTLANALNPNDGMVLGKDW